MSVGGEAPREQAPREQTRPEEPTASAEACDACLRRAHLLGFLAPRVAGVLARKEPPPSGILGLGEHDLIAAICSRDGAERAHRFLEEFRPGEARASTVASGVWSACIHSGPYPTAALTALPDPPAVIFTTGGLDRLERLLAGPAVAVVGSRRPSAYGLEMARRLGRGLAVARVTVVSGLALGIDGAAHQGAIDGGAPGIAVLARGPERPYPRTHAEIYRRVREHGCVVSELPPGVPVFRWSFPARNRIMAALSEMTVVVEAADPSGSLITAAFAADLGCRVGAVPGRVTSRVAEGANRLLRDGAEVVRSVEDVLDGIVGARAPRPVDAPPPLDPLLLCVLEAVEASDAPGGIVGRTGLGPAEVRAALGRLELLGRVRRDPMGAYHACGAP